MSAQPAAAPPSYPTRFGWPLFLFLTCLLTFMVFRSFSVLYPWRKWADDDHLKVRRYPSTGFPTKAEQRKILDDPDGGRAALRERWFDSADALWLYARPWPGPYERPNLHRGTDYLKWYLIYLNSRGNWIENAVGFDQEWPMYSPSVGSDTAVTRARLRYADGTERIVRARADPEDLTRFFRTALYKSTEFEMMVSDDRNYAGENNAYCNLLAHRHPTSDGGTDLVEVRLFKVTYKFTPPDEDPREWMKKQTGPPDDQISPDFYSYDVRSRSGRFLPEPRK
jgi:hypothetical protein